MKGDIITAGSSTVFPLSEAVAEKFREEGYGGNITIDSIGSGAGFERFCKTGETDISNASRAIKDSEKENCAKINRTPIEFRVGTDALTVVVNPANDWVKDVTLAELAKLFSKDSTNWSDVNPAWPNEPIKRFTPGTDSGTFDYFVEAVMDKAYVKDAKADKGKGEEALLGAANLQLSEDDNVLVQGVEGDKNAIGFFGFAYFNENQGKLKDLAIEGCVAEPGDRRCRHVQAGPAAVPVLGRQDHAGQAAGRRLHQLLPDQRRQRHQPGRLLPGPRCRAPGRGQDLARSHQVATLFARRGTPARVPRR